MIGSPVRAAIVLLALGAALGPAGRQDEAALGKRVDEFFAAIAKMDVDAAMAPWSASSPHLARFRKSAAEAAEYTSKSPPAEIKVTRCRVEGDKAVLTVTFKGKWCRDDEQYPDEPVTLWRLEFRKEEGAWRWWAQEPAALELARALVAADSKEKRRELMEKSRELVTFRLYAVTAQEGLNLLNSARPGEAVRRFEAAVDAAALLDRPVVMSRGQSFLAKAYLDQGKVAEGLDAARQALETAVKSGKKSPLPYAHYILGLALSTSEHPEESESHFRACLEGGNGAPPDVMAEAEGALGLLFDRRGDAAAALKWYEASLERSRALDSKVLQAQALNNLGLFLWSRGDTPGAMRSFASALELSQGLTNIELAAGLQNNIGIIHLEVGEFDEAVKCFETLQGVAKGMGRPALQAQTLNNIGLARLRQGRSEDAARAFEAALPMLKADPRMAISVLSNLGQALISMENPEQAMEACVASLKQAEALGDEAGLIPAACNVGMIFLLTGDGDKALRTFTTALEIMNRTGARRSEFAVHLGLGLSHAALKDLDKAIESFRAAIACIESSRAGLPGQAIQQSFFSDKTRAYHGLAYALLGRGREAEAFAVGERAKARTLVDALDGGRVNIVKSMSDDERKREGALEAEAGRQAQLLEKAVRTDDQIRIASELEKARGALEEFRRALFLRRPELQALRGKSEPSSLAELNASLFSAEPGLCVLAYMSSEGQTHLFVLTAGKESAALAVHRIPIRLEDLKARVREFWAECSKVGGKYEGPGHALFDLLVAPAGEKLAKASHLVIVPDGPLLGLPFQALLEPDGKHLGEKRGVSTAPSVTALAKMLEIGALRRADADPKLVPILALGAPVMPEGFSELPNAATEVRAIAGKAALTGKEATESRAKAEMGLARRILFATHGMYNDTAPMYSYLVLTRDEKNDGCLYAREIAELDLRADLVVLSACGTARGKQVEGEGIVGLTWSLLVAGAPSSVVTQWQASDESTGPLMSAFYANLAGKSKADALRLAQKTIREDGKHSHPYYWAPFILVGDWRR